MVLEWGDIRRSAERTVGRICLYSAARIKAFELQTLSGMRFCSSERRADSSTYATIGLKLFIKVDLDSRCDCGDDNIGLLQSLSEELIEEVREFRTR